MENLNGTGIRTYLRTAPYLYFKKLSISEIYLFVKYLRLQIIIHDSRYVLFEIHFKESLIRSEVARFYCY